ncbi:MAG: SDR family NAD(P)-dependent oxidoreductase [Myxococcota bacterium]|nr:SDR family NAD(P)-dependent oxidoreductase [Myxococcota bacterium]
MFDLDGRVALVTGAGQGVGTGIAACLAEQGAAVAVNDLHPERAEAVAKQLREAGGRAEAFPFDVTDADAVVAGVRALEDALGPLDVLVNNAGVPEGMGLEPFLHMDPAGWKAQIDLNLYGLLHCVHAVLPGMITRGYGRIVVISSGAAQVGLPIGVSLYGAAKAGALGFVRHLAQEVARRGVTVNAVALGLMENAAGADTEPILRTIPLGRAGTGRDAGAAVVYLASEEASWVTGQTLSVNGGSLA